MGIKKKIQQDNQNPNILFKDLVLHCITFYLFLKEILILTGVSKTWWFGILCLRKKQEESLLKEKE